MSGVVFLLTRGYMKTINRIVNVIKEHKRISKSKLCWIAKISPSTLNNYKDIILENFPFVKYDETTKEFYIEGEG
jgi:hypothetical protein